MTVTQETRPNPYVGPRAFQYGETLYGRDRKVLELLDLLIAERVVLLYSPSGAGKTSLIQTALIPELERKGFHVLPVMRAGLKPPSVERVANSCNHYVVSLLFSLDEALPPEQGIPLAELAGMTLADYLDRRQAEAIRSTGQPSDPPASTALVFDQFEEILTVEPAGQGDLFCPSRRGPARGLCGRPGPLSALPSHSAEHDLPPLICRRVSEWES